MGQLQQNSLRQRRSRDIYDFLILRKATAIDDAEIGALLVKAFIETYRAKLPQIQTNQERITELQNVASRREHGEVVVLELGYRIIGTCSIIHPSSTDSQSWLSQTANIRCVAVDPEFHGLAFSDILLNEAERLAASWDSRHICLHIQEGAEGVGRLYEKRGFIREPAGDLNCSGNMVLGYKKDLNPMTKICLSK